MGLTVASMDNDLVTGLTEGVNRLPSAFQGLSDKDQRVVEIYGNYRDKAPRSIYFVIMSRLRSNQPTRELHH